MRALAALLFTALFASAQAQAALATVATTTSAEMLLREVGGTAITITTLAPPDRDVHTLQVKPSMMRALRGARLVVAIGAELESGWLPLAISSAANPRILPGQDGYFEIAAQVPLLAKQVADRAKGDVHPMGNPHVQMDPVRMADAGLALAERLARLDPANAAAYRAGAQRFQQAVQAQLPAWQQQLAGVPGALLYHKDADYLMARFNVPILGYVEPLPGMPPTAAHLARLVGQLRGGKGVILHTLYQSNAGLETLAQQLGWKHLALPIDPPASATASAYFALIGQWTKALAAAR
ncbi:MAG: zinc transporter substrate-binding protein [Moraxellaceae bacterium]|jgi:zinc/manganese transport system substrate-binding protein|nr:zinc transporter substrate-binding protein [Moraxellaceae bacterium]